MNALFDLDGTLCDPREGILQGFRHAFAAVGRAYPGDGQAAAQIGRPLGDCFRALGCGADAAEAARRFQSFFEARGFAEARLYEGVAECLDELRDAGWNLALASAKPSAILGPVIRDLGLAGRLKDLFGCGDDELDPDKGAIVSSALAVLRWDADRTVLIGDRAQDRDAARTLGLAFVAAAWGFGEAEEHLGAAAVAGSPAELPGLLERVVRRRVCSSGGGPPRANLRR